MEVIRKRAHGHGAVLGLCLLCFTMEREASFLRGVVTWGPSRHPAKPMLCSPVS